MPLRLEITKFMCTVTIFYKGNNDFVLTSNRDEAPNRNAIAPSFYTVNSAEIVMPKDELSGGSWIGTSNRNRVVCLLNGGFESHKRKAVYRKSRGLVVNDLLLMESIHNVQNYDFTNIEPFTIVIADWKPSINFYEIVWDGEKAYFNQLGLKTRIWSSSTLYNKVQKQTRHHWFEVFKTKNELNANTLLNFHQTAGNGNEDYGVIMDRGLVKTTSITQIEKTGDSVLMTFHDLKTHKTSSETLNLSEIINE